jgi:hypothetical protein
VILFKEILSALTRQNLYDPNILQQGKDVERIKGRALGMLPIRKAANIISLILAASRQVIGRRLGTGLSLVVTACATEDQRCKVVGGPKKTFACT